MRMVDIIEKKRDGHQLTSEETDTQMVQFQIIR